MKGSRGGCGGEERGCEEGRSVTLSQTVPLRFSGSTERNSDSTCCSREWTVDLTLCCKMLGDAKMSL